jgi:hypothetical protein
MRPRTKIFKSTWKIIKAVSDIKVELLNNGTVQRNVLEDFLFWISDLVGKTEISIKLFPKFHGDSKISMLKFTNKTQLLISDIQETLKWFETIHCDELMDFLIAVLNLTKQIRESIRNIPKNHYNSDSFKTKHKVWWEKQKRL